SLLKQSVQLTTSAADATRASLKNVSAAMEHAKNIDEEVLEVLSKRRAELKATLLVRKQLEKLGLSPGGLTGIEKELNSLQKQRDQIINQSGSLNEAQQERLRQLGTEIFKANKILEQRKKL